MVMSQNRIKLLIDRHPVNKNNVNISGTSAICVQARQDNDFTLSSFLIGSIVFLNIFYKMPRVMIKISAMQTGLHTKRVSTSRLAGEINSLGFSTPAMKATWNKFSSNLQTLGKSIAKPIFASTCARFHHRVAKSGDSVMACVFHRILIISRLLSTEQRYRMPYRYYPIMTFNIARPVLLTHCPNSGSTISSFSCARHRLFFRIVITFHDVSGIVPRSPFNGKMLNDKVNNNCCNIELVILQFYMRSDI